MIVILIVGGLVWYFVFRDKKKSKAKDAEKKLDDKPDKVSWFSLSNLTLLY